MRGRSGPLLVVVVLLLASLSGCIADMGDLKRDLGATETPPRLPDSIPPVADARANVTRTLTGIVVGFTSAGSEDPDGIIALFEWDMGDGTVLEGPLVSHVFEDAGEHEVTLTVTDDDDLTATASLTVSVDAGNAPPVAALHVRDARGRAVTSGDAGAPLTFTARGSGDPDGDAVTYAWDFGDGAGAARETARHRYARPGSYLVTLTVEDEAGATATRSRIVTQNLNRSWPDEAFEPSSGKGDTKRYGLPVPEDASGVDVVLTFDAGFGTTDLDLELRDDAGDPVARANVETEAGDQGNAEKRVTLTPEALRHYAAGDWTLVVTKTGGIGVEYALAASVLG